MRPARLPVGKGRGQALSQGKGAGDLYRDQETPAAHPPYCSSISAWGPWLGKELRLGLKKLLSWGEG